MHNYFAQFGALVLTLTIAGISSLRLTSTDIAKYLPEQESEQKETNQLEALLKLQQILQSNLLIVNLLLLYLLATANYDIFQVIAFAFLWLIAMHLLAATKSVQKHARRLAIAHLPLLVKIAEGMRPALSLLDSSRFLIVKRPDAFASKEEMLNAITKSQGVLSANEKQRIRSILTEADANTT